MIDELLSDQTFTVCTGHQLNLFTGPAYFIYKIAACIKQAQQASQQSGKSVLPIYWMASEDHDWEEINHTHLWRNKITWSKQVKGPVGRTSLQGLEAVLKEFKEILGGQSSSELEDLFQLALDKATNLSEFTFLLVDQLFKDEPLIILNPDSKELKRLFSPVMKSELLERPSEKRVLENSQMLENLGYHAQVNARKINLFYIENELRDRIVEKNEGFSTPNGNIEWTKTEMLNLLESNPESFSPNVVLRPLYQEFILPNLAYIGGPGELAYWMQLKGVFDHFGVEFPQLILRNSVLFIKEKDLQKMEKLDLSLSDFYSSIDPLLSRWGAETGNTKLTDVEEMSKEVWTSLENRVVDIDKSLQGAVKALEQKFNNDLRNLEKKLVKSVKQAEATKVNQIRKFHESIQPNGVFQERYMNFFALAGNDFRSVISALIEEMSAEEASLIIYSL